MPSKRDAMTARALALVGCGYIYGATGWICTRARMEQQMRQYPAYAGQIERYGKKWIGKPCYDCAQLTRDVARRAGVSLPSGATSQWRAAGIWKEKDVIDTLPDEAGIFLFTMRDGRMTHTGVSVGHGEEVDARGHAYGVVRRPIRGTTFTHWARLAVDYDAQEDAGKDAGEETPLKPRRTLRMGSSGEDVRAANGAANAGLLKRRGGRQIRRKDAGGRSEIPEKERACGRWNRRRGDVGGLAGGGWRAERPDAGLPDRRRHARAHPGA